MDLTAIVLKAYRAGSRTIDEVNALTGVAKQMISSITSRLVKQGFIVRTGNDGRVHPSKRIRGFYEPRT